MKKYWWGLPVMALSLVGVHQLNQEKLPDNISRAVAQVEEETIVSSMIAESIREITALQSEIDLKVEALERLTLERDEINEKLTTEALSEAEVFELDEREVALGLEIDALQLEIDGLIENQDLLTAQLEDKEAERNLILCQSQQVTSELEQEIQGLLSDKEEVTNRVIALSENSDKLNDEIADLRALVTGDDNKKQRENQDATIAQDFSAANQQFDMNMLLQAITSLAQSLQFSLQSQQPNMGMMNFQPTATMQMPGMSSAMHQWHNNPIYFQNPYNYYTPPISRMNQGSYMNDWLQGSAQPHMRPQFGQQFQMPQPQAQQQTLQAPQLPQVGQPIPSGNRGISSDASYFTF